MSTLGNLGLVLLHEFMHHEAGKRVGDLGLRGDLIKVHLHNISVINIKS